MIALLCLAAVATGQPDAIAISNVRVLVGDGSELPAATVVIDGGVIRSVGSKKPPRAIPVIDGGGKILTPGLIESLNPLGLVELNREASTNDARLLGQAVPGFRAADALNLLTPRIPVARAQGITSVHSTPRGTLLYGTSAFFDLTGKLDSAPDPRAPAALVGGITGAAAESYGSRGGMWLHLREIFADARFLRAQHAAFDAGKSRPLTLPPLHLQAVWPVLARQIPLLLVVHRASDIAAALRFAREQKIRLVVAGATEAWLLAAELAQQKVPVILKASEQLPRNFDMLAARDDAPLILHRAGVKLILTTAGYHSMLPRLRQEAGIAVAHGLPRGAALRAITLTPAEVFGRGHQLGSIQVNKRADLVLWSGDPFELETVAEKVWIEGRQQSADTRQQKLARRYMQRFGLVPAR